MGSCLQISRRLQRATWMAGPGRGTRAPCCQGAGWKEPGCARPARGVKLPPALVPSPALGPPLQGQVPAKAPSAEAHHPAVRGEMHVRLGAAGPWQGGPGRAWIASLAKEPGLLLPVSALTDETDKLPQHLPPSPSPLPSLFLSSSLRPGSAAAGTCRRHFGHGAGVGGPAESLQPSLCFCLPEAGLRPPHVPSCLRPVQQLMVGNCRALLPC